MVAQASQARTVTSSLTSSATRVPRSPHEGQAGRGSATGGIGGQPTGAGAGAALDTGWGPSAPPAVHIDPARHWQQGHVAAWQLLGLGLTRRAVHRLVRRLMWIPVHRGVWRLPGIPPSAQGAIWAAILAAVNAAHRFGDHPHGSEPVSWELLHARASSAIGATGFSGAQAEADIAIPLIRLDIEIDGPHHDEPAQRAADRYRDARMRRVVWTVRRYPVAMLDDDDAPFRAAVTADIVQAAAGVGIQLLRAA